MNTCPNCAATYNGNYCNECGQKYNSGRIYFKELVSDFFSNFFTLESPIYRTVKNLSLKPGEVINNFISAKRKIYYKPVQYFILVLAFHLLVRTSVGFNPIENQFKAMGKTMPPKEYLQTVQMQASFFMAENVNLLLFIFVFILALLTRLFFRKSNYNYTEHLVSGFYLIGQYILLSTFVIPLSFIEPGLYYLVYLILLGYLSFALISIHKTNLLTGIIKSLFTITVSFIIYVAIVYTAVIYFINIFQK